MKLLQITVPRIISTLLAATMFTACDPISAISPDPLQTLKPVSPTLSVDAIMARAHDAAGGPQWSSPTSLIMDGYGVFYKVGPDGTETTTHERHRMWRVYASGKTDAHSADGKVRITSTRDGVAVIDVSYDGATTYTAAGPQPKSEADKAWASNFGFGVIRHAFDEGYNLSRLPDDLIDGRPAFMIDVRDAAGGSTIFGIAQDNSQILKVGFDTARGWHERIYSDFYSNLGETWVQPGRVRLYYNGVKANEVIWTSYRIGEPIADCVFVIPTPMECEMEL